MKNHFVTRLSPNLQDYDALRVAVSVRNFCLTGLVSEPAGQIPETGAADTAERRIFVAVFLVVVFRRRLGCQKRRPEPVGTQGERPSTCRHHRRHQTASGSVSSQLFRFKSRIIEEKSISKKSMTKKQAMSYRYT